MSSADPSAASATTLGGTPGTAEGVISPEVAGGPVPAEFTAATVTR
jgi:hypothetical protein